MVMEYANPSISTRYLRVAVTLFAAAALAGLVIGCGKDKTSKPKEELPTVLAVSPDSGNVGTRVAITGSNFQTGAEVRFGHWPALFVERISDTTILAYAPDSLVAGVRYEVGVNNPGGEAVVLDGAYKAVLPRLRVIDGVSRPSGNHGSPVILEGNSFGDLLAKGTVYFTDGGGQPVAAAVELPENWTNEFIVATVPASAESGPVWVDTPTGISESIVFTIAQSATFSPSLITWTRTSALPDSVQGCGAIFLPIEGGTAPGNLIFVTGGANGAVVPQSSVWLGEVSDIGEVQQWAFSTDLPGPRAFHGSVVATPYNAFVDTTSAGHLYVLGGIDSSGTPIASVSRATIGRDRSLSSWEEMTPLPAPLHSMGVIVFRSWIFVAGGAGIGNEPVANVYRARIHYDGSLGQWESLTPLPEARSYAPLVQFAGVLYVMGGETSAVAPGAGGLTGTSLSSIDYSRLDLRTAELASGSWSLNPSTLIKSVAKHSAIVAGATVLVSGGLYSGATNSATEHQYAEINADYTIGSFNGATGSHTIGGSSGAGGVPFFNHGAITYVDGSGAAHVVIIGGADVNDPASALQDVYYY